jgi:cytochrome c oxidase subunit 2
MRAQDILASAGPQAQHVEALWWLTLGICLVVFVAILAAVAWALLRAPRGDGATPPDISFLGVRERRAELAVGAAVAVSALGLVALILASFVTDRALAGIGAPALQIDLTGHRWWWDARYDDQDKSKIFTTANELHIPVGKPVLLRLKADDVIHSFWVPNLSGKKDMIPGREATITLQADKPGVYRGQCAEFCGVQHAKMALLVIAEEDYESWAAAQRKPAAEPADAQQKQGRELFVKGRCGMCHAIQGTPANARRAPDLTHFASRKTIGAGAVPNSVGHLAGWILDPHSIKPGVNMPANPMAPEDLHALLAYLESLK